MKVKGEVRFGIEDNLFTFRSLNPDDVKMSYILALKRQKSFIENRLDDITMDFQKKYVGDIIRSSSDTICGLFTQDELVGTSGIQNISADNYGKRTMKMGVGHTRDPTMGVFVFHDSRGKRFAQTIIWSACYLISSELKVILVKASALKRNTASIRAFQKIGFVITDENEIAVNLELDMANLVKPAFLINPCII